MELAAPQSHNQKTFWNGPFDHQHRRVDVLKLWVKMRMRYPEIAGKLGTTVGAVCGKVSRLGIGQGAPPTRQKSNLKKQPAQEPDPEFFAIMRDQTMEAFKRSGDTVALADLEEKHCSFVIGDPAKAAYCGHERVPGLPYCAAHAARCYPGKALPARARPDLELVPA